MNSTRMLILLCVFFIEYELTCSSNTTTHTTWTNTGLDMLAPSTKVFDNSTSKNVIKRRSVLIVNSGMTSLRSKHQKKAESLLYEERDYYGNKLKSVMMYNLDEVAKFLKENLDVEVCVVRCEGDED